MLLMRKEQMCKRIRECRATDLKKHTSKIGESGHDQDLKRYCKL